MHEAQSGIGPREPGVSLQMLDSLHGLNYRFLELVATSSNAWNSSRWTGSCTELAGQVAPLSAAQKQAIARCPYALFDMRFHDNGHWHTRLQDSARWGVSDECDAAESKAEFVRLALFFAWHVAASATPAARFLLGMSEATATAFRCVTIDRLPALAASESDQLTARWSHSPSYWTALTTAAIRLNSSMLRRIQLSGLQLTAAAHLS